jgi:hypothetical protein
VLAVRINNIEKTKFITTSVKNKTISDNRHTTLVFLLFCFVLQNCHFIVKTAVLGSFNLSPSRDYNVGERISASLQLFSSSTDVLRVFHLNIYVAFPYRFGGTEDRLVTHDGGGSGGYLEYILKYAAQEFYGLQLDQVQYKILR